MSNQDIIIYTGLGPFSTSMQMIISGALICGKHALKCNSCSFVTGWITFLCKLPEILCATILK